MLLFGLFNTVSNFVVLLYNLLHFRKKKQLLGGVSNSLIHFFSQRKRNIFSRVLGSAALWIILETILISVAQYYISGFLNRPVGNLLNTGANYFGLIISGPLWVFLLCFLLKIDFSAQMDLITPAYPLALIFVKIACHFGCCCRGVVWEHGLYNPVTRQIEFPAPFLEAGVALLIFVFLICCKNKFKKGTIYPIYLMVYSGTRFFTEFTRVEPAVFLGLKTYQIICIVAVLIGAAEYIVVRIYHTRCLRKQESGA